MGEVKKNLKQMTTQEFQEGFPKLVVLAPDGAQGGKLKLGLNSSQEEESLNGIFKTIKERRIKPDLKKLTQMTQEAGLKRVDI